MKLPAPYGYRYRNTDVWTLNYMLHNLTPATFKAKIVYDLDWVPMDSTIGRTLTPVWPLWLDVQRGSGYPVFNPFKDTGTAGTISRSGETIRFKKAYEMTATGYTAGPESSGKYADGYTAIGMKATASSVGRPPWAQWATVKLLTEAGR